MRWFLPLLLLPRLAQAGVLESSKEIDGSAFSPSSITITATTGLCLHIGSDGLSVTVDCGAKEVGIGTTDPRSKLDVRGPANVSSTADIFRVSSNTTTDFLLIRNDGSVTIAPNTATSSTFTAAGNLTLASGGALTLSGSAGTVTAGSSVTLNGTLFAVGRAMVGATAAPASTLDVEGGISVGASYSGTTAAPSNGMIIQGNVGIGTTAASDVLHIGGSAGGIRIERTGAGDPAFIGFWPESLQRAEIYGTRNGTSGDLRLRVSNAGTMTEYLSIDGARAEVGVGAAATRSTFTSAGNVLVGANLGIGTTAPATKLHLSSGTLRVDGTTPQIIVSTATAETIAAAATITADACGALKGISATGAVATNTTDTFTAPSGANAGCCMDVLNTGANAITLDNNAKFFSAGAADVVLGANDTVRVCSNGTSWFQIGGTGNN